jgi:hypothetical protein
MIIDNSADFCLLDNLGPLTLQVAGLPDVSIPAAVSMPAEYAELDPSGGNVLKGDQCFAWPQSASPRPPLGSTILDAAGDAWTVLAVDAKGDVKTWDCHARNLKIANRLDNTAAVWEASYAQSPGGEALPAWTEVLSGIAARFQPVEQSAQVLEDADWPKTVYHVLLGTDIFAPQIPVEPASADYRLVDSAGRHFRIVQYQRAERIDVLPLAVCVLVIEGAEGAAEDRVSSSSGGN